MTLMKHIQLRCKHIVVFMFLLLNSFLVSAPLANAALADNLIDLAGLLTQSQSIDLDDNILGKTISEVNIEYNQVVRSKQRVLIPAKTIGIIPYANTTNDVLAVDRSGSWIRPAYYCQLFRCQLF